MNIEIIEIKYNRNGISGQPFSKVLFNLTDDGATQTLVGIVPDGAKYTEVMVINPLFWDRAYRGDNLGKELVKAVKQFHNEK